jgi:hypothetical protein
MRCLCSDRQSHFCSRECEYCRSRPPRRSIHFVDKLLQFSTGKLQVSRLTVFLPLFSSLILVLYMLVFVSIFVLLIATFHVAGPFQPGWSWQGFCATRTFAAAISWAAVTPTVLASIPTLLRSTDAARIRIKDSLQMAVLRNGPKVLNPPHLMCAAHRESGMDALPLLSPELLLCNRSFWVDSLAFSCLEHTS